MGLEGLGGLEELDDERVREGVEVLGGGREAGVVGAVEGELAEADGGGEREGLAEFLDVERGVDKDYVEASLFQLEGQSQEGDYVALAHEWEHNNGFLLALRHFSSHFRFLSFFVEKVREKYRKDQEKRNMDSSISGGVGDERGPTQVCGAHCVVFIKQYKISVGRL